MISSLHAKKFRMLFEQNIASNITRNQESKHIKMRNHVKPLNCTKLCITAQKLRITTKNYAKLHKTMQNQSKICKILRNHSEQLFGTYRNLLSLKKPEIFDLKKVLQMKKVESRTK